MNFYLLMIYVRSIDKAIIKRWHNVATSISPIVTYTDVQVFIE